MESALEKIVSPYKGKNGVVIPVLQEIQSRLGYISPEAVETMARELGISENEIYGVASFYAQFRFEKPGKHTLKVCLGTACHVRGAVSVLEELERSLGIKSGQTTKDAMFTLETVMCLGACALGPVVVLDEDYHGQMNPAKTRKLLEEAQREG
jgi:NADH-quinone oxidoreductase subunit E